MALHSLFVWCLWIGVGIFFSVFRITFVIYHEDEIVQVSQPHVKHLMLSDSSECLV